MQLDFHYYATYCAACLAGYEHEESLAIAYSAQFVDCCTRTLLKKIGAPGQAATTQLQSEMMDADTDIQGLHDITRIWASFHFLPRDLYANPERRCNSRYLRKYRLICGPNGDLLVRTVQLAKGRGLQAAGLAMHVLADTWAHQYFAGTPSLVINNTSSYFYEILPEGERQIRFIHNPVSADDIEKGSYTASIHRSNENSIMNLGHGRAGHFPDYSWAKYRYLPAWGNYREIVKNNPLDYLHAFCQMVYALKYLRGEIDTFEANQYDITEMLKWKHEIAQNILKRQLDASEDWKKLGEKISGQEPEDFDIEKYQSEYMNAAKDSKDDTFLGRFIIAALEQKSMVTNQIFKSGSRLAGVSIDYEDKGFKGIKEFRMLIDERNRETENDQDQKSI